MKGWATGPKGKVEYKKRGEWGWGSGDEASPFGSLVKGQLTISGVSHYYGQLVYSFKVRSACLSVWFVCLSTYLVGVSSTGVEGMRLKMLMEVSESVILWNHNITFWCLKANLPALLAFYSVYLSSLLLPSLFTYLLEFLLLSHLLKIWFAWKIARLNAGGISPLNCQSPVDTTHLPSSSCGG